jgi:glycosyltransferase involved in cell wall biosynthesis
VPVINFVGRTGIEKAPDLVLKAAVKLAARGLTFGVQILGSNHWDRLEMDDYQRELQRLAADLESRGIAVRRPGHIARAALPGELRRADIHVVPSRWEEPFALTILEGMACGLATIASRTGGAPEVVGDAGLLFERDDVDGLAEQLARLMTDPALRGDYARRARARAEEFTWDKTWEGFRKVTQTFSLRSPLPADCKTAPLCAR